jgi:hypothetical protein
MLNGPYVVINQLIKSIWKVAHLETIYYTCKGKRKSISNQKMTKIGIY